MRERGLEWRPIKGYEDLYLVSNYGHVKSLSKKVKHYKYKFAIRKEKNLKVYEHPSGYNVVTLIKNGKRKLESVHRLVGFAFVENPENKPQINHIDCDRRNNFYKNLEWVTNVENQHHAIANGRVNYLKGSKHGKSKTDEITVYKIKSLYSSGLYKQSGLALRFGLSKSMIKQIVNNITWKHVKI